MEGIDVLPGGPFVIVNWVGLWPDRVKAKEKSKKKAICSIQKVEDRQKVSDVFKPLPTTASEKEKRNQKGTGKKKHGKKCFRQGGGKMSTEKGKTF